MSVVLFCEGRLEPGRAMQSIAELSQARLTLGTPPWLMHMYIMAIVGAFMPLRLSRKKDHLSQTIFQVFAHVCVATRLS